MARVQIEAEVTIDRPAAEVFRFVAVDHCRNHPTWDPHVVRIDPPAEGTMGLGRRLTIVRRTMGREETRVFEVTSWAEPTQMTITTRSKDFDLSLSSTCEAAGTGTRLRLAGDARVGGFRALLAPVMKRKFTAEIRANLERIKAGVESAAPAMTRALEPAAERTA